MLRRRRSCSNDELTTEKDSSPREKATGSYADARSRWVRQCCRTSVEVSTSTPFTGNLHGQSVRHVHSVRAAAGGASSLPRSRPVVVSLEPPNPETLTRSMWVGDTARLSSAGVTQGGRSRPHACQHARQRSHRIHLRDRRHKPRIPEGRRTARPATGCRSDHPALPERQARPLRRSR